MRRTINRIALRLLKPKGCRNGVLFIPVRDGRPTEPLLYQEGAKIDVETARLTLYQNDSHHYAVEASIEVPDA